MLKYSRIDNLEVIGYFDAYLIDLFEYLKLTSSYIFMLADGVVSWRSAKQTLTVTSTMEVEFVSCFKATLHGIWLKSFRTSLRIIDSISIYRPLKSLCDNPAMVFITKNNKSGS